MKSHIVDLYFSNWQCLGKHQKSIKDAWLMRLHYTLVSSEVVKPAQQVVKL
jgi:hypothetical protein